MTSTSVPRRPAIRVWMMVMAMAVLATACRPKEPKLFPAAGEVRIGGKPAANIAVQFLPDEVVGEPRPTSFATTDADGRFQLRAPGGKDGAVLGGHSIILADCDEDRPAQGEASSRPPRLHGKYTTLAGKLRATVVENGPPLTIEVPAYGAQ